MHPKKNHFLILIKLKFNLDLSSFYSLPIFPIGNTIAVISIKIKAFFLFFHPRQKKTNINKSEEKFLETTMKVYGAQKFLGNSTMKALLLTPTIVMHLLKSKSVGRVFMLECCRASFRRATAQGPDSLFRMVQKQSVLNHIRPPP